MGIARNILLAGSRSAWLREQAGSYAFVRRAVSRFMPGESLDEAVDAAKTLKVRGLGAILTHLGENVGEVAEAVGVTRHYLEVLDRADAERIGSEISVKLTHLGLDLGEDLAVANLEQLAEKADAVGSRTWVDMEDSSYVDRTLAVFTRVQKRHRRLGICLQAYLYRTEKDLESLIPLGCGVRIVKGAYKEPPSVAWPRKSDVDASFLKLAQRLLEPESLGQGAVGVFGTHDQVLIRKINAHAAKQGLSKNVFEYALLYGIRPEMQYRLAEDGYRVRTLISYGAYWFPWYMRRLAERPANVGFVLRSILGR
ncbi:MAG TPA: proline dehydrogenase family protein [Candidatus Saccharimonadales bacterium]|nr:proline dehydrogenase family protein [Candidatus Saccharimonadales bacterium]